MFGCKIVGCEGGGGPRMKGSSSHSDLSGTPHCRMLYTRHRLHRRKVIFSTINFVDESPGRMGLPRCLSPV